MSTKDGGPDFPFTEYNHDGSIYRQALGASMRDYFAAHVDMGDMDGFSKTTGESLLGRPCPMAMVGDPETFKGCLEWWAEYRAVLRFIEADAMLKVREKA